jgi:hypothetical protein
MHGKAIFRYYVAMLVEVAPDLSDGANKGGW